MRIWHEKLIPKLCQKHLCAMWRESLGCFKIITENKKGYRNHPAVKEFENNLDLLHEVLKKVRIEMLNRKYHPKPLPELNDISSFINQFGCSYKPWQDLDTQIKLLRNKGCRCNI